MISLWKLHKRWPVIGISNGRHYVYIGLQWGGFKFFPGVKYKWDWELYVGFISIKQKYIYRGE